MEKESLIKEFNNLNNTSSLEDVQKYISKMLISRGFEKESLQDRMLLLTEEIGELAREVRKTTNIKMDSNKSRESNIENELVDVFMYIFSICDLLKINIFDAFKNKEERNFNRE